MSLDLFRMLRDNVRTNLSTALARVWRRQQGLDANAQVPQGASVKFDLETFQHVADDVARNMAQVLGDVVDLAQEQCKATHEHHPQGCNEFGCPFYVDPSW